MKNHTEYEKRRRAVELHSEGASFNKILQVVKCFWNIHYNTACIQRKGIWDIMKVCIVGGIFDKPEDYRTRNCFTPETVLSSGLRSHGIEVITFGHKNFDPDVKCDLIHVHHLGRATIKQAISKSRAPFVYTSHDPLLVSDYHLPWRRALATRYVVGCLDAVVVLSQRELTLMLEKYGRCPINPVIIPNGFPVDVFYWKEGVVKQEGHYKLLFVGQLIPQKGLDVLLGAFKNLCHSYNIQLLLVYQPSSLEKNYKEIVIRMGLQDKVFFLGFKSAFELAELYRIVDLFVLPSYAEALPSVITEALMCGTPVISTGVAGIPEQVGKYGILVKPGDMIELTNAISKAINNITYLRELSKERSLYARSKFSVSSMIEKHITLYENVIATCILPRRFHKKHLIGKFIARSILTVHRREM